MGEPLKGIRVVDLSAVVSGPLTTLVLADQGAEVIKVEPPDLGDLGRYVGPSRNGIGAMFAGFNRNKRSLAVNLRAEEGCEILRALCARADVFVQNFRPGAIARMGFGHEQLCALNPNLIYVSISGFGSSGPYAQRRVYDPVIQAVSGVAATQADPQSGDPELVRTLICDKVTGLVAAQAVTAALLARERGAGGQHVEIAMLEAALAFLWPDAMWNETFLSGDVPPAPTLGLLYDVVRAADGFVAGAVLSDAEYRGFCKAVGRADLIEDPRFATIAARMGNFQAFQAEVRAAFARFDRAALLARLDAEGVPYGQINMRHEVADDPQVRHLGSVAEITHPIAGPMRQVRPPARFDGESGSLRHPAPRLGEHTDAVLAELGIAAERIAALRAARIVA